MEKKKKKEKEKKEDSDEEPDGEDEIPLHFVCSITYEIMREPVVASDGHTYEKSAIENWLKMANTSPMTGAALESKNLVANHALKSVILDYIDKNKKRENNKKAKQEKK